MYTKLRRTFLWGSALVLLAVIGLVIGILFWATANTVSRQTQVMINLILDNGGELPEQGRFDSQQEMFLALNEGSIQETMFFSALSSEDGIHLVSKRIFGLQDEEAVAVAELALQQPAERGNANAGGRHWLQYAKRETSDGSTLIVFVDSSSRYRLARLIVVYMATVWGVVLILFVVLMSHYSRKLVRPFVENDEKQKRFITNASHELKTPLAVISANNEMAEAIGGKTKWTESTSRQVKRLQSLIEDLVVLTRLDEMKEIALSDIEFSPMVRESAESFRSVVESSGRRYECSLEDGIRVRGEKRTLQQVTAILLDNAAKYCDEGGKVAVRLAGKGRSAVLTVSNTYAEAARVDTSRFFERFYRQDESHNSGKSGFGIGLSMAKEMTERMKGKMKAAASGDTITFTVEIPRAQAE